MKLHIPVQNHDSLLSLVELAQADIASFDKFKQREAKLLTENSSYTAQITKLAPQERLRDLDAINKLGTLRGAVELVRGELAKLENEKTQHVKTLALRLDRFFSASLMKAFGIIRDAEEVKAMGVLARYCSNEIATRTMFRTTELGRYLMSFALNYRLPTGDTEAAIVASLNQCIYVATLAADGDPAFMGFMSHSTD